MEDQELARLLAGRDGPSVLEQEAIWRRVLTALPGQRPRPLWAWAIPAAAAVGALLLFALPAEFGARGAPHRPALRVLCVEPHSAGSCPSGSTLAFEVAAASYRYLALFAQGAEGLTIWYFPSQTGQSFALGPQARASAVLQQGVRLGAQQPPGRYQVVAVFSQAPLTREQVKRTLAGSIAGTSVVRQPFVVGPPR